jgi:hypothetical protein
MTHTFCTVRFIRCMDSSKFHHNLKVIYSHLSQVTSIYFIVLSPRRLISSNLPFQSRFYLHILWPWEKVSVTPSILTFYLRIHQEDRQLTWSSLTGKPKYTHNPVGLKNISPQHKFQLTYNQSTHPGAIQSKFAIRLSIHSLKQKRIVTLISAQHRASTRLQFHRNLELDIINFSQEVYVKSWN